MAMSQPDTAVTQPGRERAMSNAYQDEDVFVETKSANPEHRSPKAWGVRQVRPTLQPSLHTPTDVKSRKPAGLTPTCSAFQISLDASFLDLALQTQGFGTG